MTHSATGSPLPPLRHSATPRLVRSTSSGFLQRRVRLEQYTLERIVSEGGNGAVGVASTTNPEGKRELVAVKRTLVKGERYRRSRKVRDPAGAIREAQMQARCHDHPNIATAFDLVQDHQYVFLVMEFGNNGDLFDYVTEGGCLGADEGFVLLRQLASAVAHMHARNIAHLDIKPENVVLTNNAQTAMLADFGCAVEFKPGSPLLQTRVGTVRCQPPEMFVDQDHSGVCKYDPMQADAWALGVVLFFMLTTRFPFDGVDQQETISNIRVGRVTSALPREVPESAVALLKAMLRPSPSKRATVQEVVGMLDAIPNLPPQSEHGA